MPRSDSTSFYFDWTQPQSPLEDDNTDNGTASVQEYVNDPISSLGDSSRYPYRYSDPHPMHDNSFTESASYYAQSEPTSKTYGSAVKHPSKNKGCYYDRSNRELEGCQRRLKQCELEKNAAKEAAESHGVRLFHCLKKAKEFTEAEKLYREDLERRISAKSEDEAILNLNHSLAEMLIAQKRFQDAEPISRGVWEKRKQCQGPPSEVSKESHRQLCSVLCALGKYKDAENMQRSMYQSETIDLWTLENGDELCQRLREQGDIKGAERTQMEVWTKRQTHVGPGDSLTVRSGLRLIDFLEQLVATIENQDGSDAEKRLNSFDKKGFECKIEVILRKIWETRQQPELNTDILSAGHKLGVVVFDQGEFSEAETIFIPVWESKKQRLGNKDPSTMSTGCKLAKTLCRHGEQETYRKAVDILQDIWQTMMMSGNPDAISSGDDLAQAYFSIGDWSGVERVSKWVYNEKVQKRYPMREIEDTQWILGQALHKQGIVKSPEAQSILGRLYQQWNASSLDTSLKLDCGYMLAESLSAQERNAKEAQKVAQDVFDGRRASMEGGVPYLVSGYLYGSLLFKDGKSAEAENVLESVWEQQVEEPEVQKVRLKCGQLFGQILTKRRKFSDAKKVLEAVAEDQGAAGAGILEMAETRRLLEDVNRLKKETGKAKRKVAPRRFFL